MANPNTGVFESGEVATLTLGGVDISEYCESIKLDRKGKEDRHRMLGSSGVVVLVQDPENTLTVDGLIDPTVAAVFTTNQGSGKPLVAFIYGPQGPAGMQRTGFCRIVDYDEETSGDKAGMFKATCAINGAVIDS